MIELPEAAVLCSQIKNIIPGKKIDQVVVNQNPQKLAWFWKDPLEYPGLLKGSRVTGAAPSGGLVEIFLDDYRLTLSDGVRIAYNSTPDMVPAKHQLLLSFEDGSSLSFSVQMYGGISCFKDGENDNPYYTVTKEKPSPLSAGFSLKYFLDLFTEKTEKLSVKAFMATEQRIPGLGNGSLQDILWRAKLHPKRKVVTLEGDEKKRLYEFTVSTIKDMADRGGRNTEKDIFGNPGGYEVAMGAARSGKACPACGKTVVKESYMGGSIYFCPSCQIL